MTEEATAIIHVAFEKGVEKVLVKDKYSKINNPFVEKIHSDANLVTDLSMNRKTWSKAEYDKLITDANNETDEKVLYSWHLSNGVFFQCHFFLERLVL